MSLLILKKNSGLGSGLLLIFNLGKFFSFSMPQVPYHNDGDTCFPSHCLGCCPEKLTVILHPKV